MICTTVLKVMLLATGMQANLCLEDPDLHTEFDMTCESSNLYLTAVEDKTIKFIVLERRCKYADNRITIK